MVKKKKKLIELKSMPIVSPILNKKREFK